MLTCGFKSIYYSIINNITKLNEYEKRRNAKKPGFQRFNHVLMWQE